MDGTTLHPRVQRLLDKLGLQFIAGGTIVISDIELAETCYVHHTSIPVAATAYALASPIFARGRFPKLLFLDLVSKRPGMDESEAQTLAAVCGVHINPPFWGSEEPFAKQLLHVLDKYQLGELFEQDPSRGHNHYAVTPRGFDSRMSTELLGGLAAWRKAYRGMAPDRQIMAASIVGLYRGGSDKTWLSRVPKTWSAVEGISTLRGTGALADWAHLVARYPGW